MRGLGLRCLYYAHLSYLTRTQETTIALPFIVPVPTIWVHLEEQWNKPDSQIENPISGIIVIVPELSAITCRTYFRHNIIVILRIRSNISLIITYSNWNAVRSHYKPLGLNRANTKRKAIIRLRVHPSSSGISTTGKLERSTGLQSYQPSSLGSNTGSDSASTQTIPKEWDRSMTPCLCKLFKVDYTKGITKFKEISWGFLCTSNINIYHHPNSVCMSNLDSLRRTPGPPGSPGRLSTPGRHVLFVNT
jgi:hypothetical protein